MSASNRIISQYKDVHKTTGLRFNAQKKRTSQLSRNKKMRSRNRNGTYTFKKSNHRILCWEEGSNPRGLAQLEKLPGNSTNPKTFAFPVDYCRIGGANIHTLLEKPSQNVLQSMIGEARNMEKRGVRAITAAVVSAPFFRENWPNPSACRYSLPAGFRSPWCRTC